MATAMLLALLIPGIGAVLAATDDSVEEVEASVAAMNLVGKSFDKFPEWAGATVNEPVTYFAPDNSRAAYEFTVLNGEKKVGYIITSARKDWMPVLEYSDGNAPTSYLLDARSMAVEKGFIHADNPARPQYYYWGALTYSVQFGTSMKDQGAIVHLPSGRILSLPKEIPQLQMNSSEARNSWDSVLSKSNQGLLASMMRLFDAGVTVKAASISPSNNNPLDILNTSVTLSSFPAYYQGQYWYEHGDNYDQSQSFPTCVGNTGDPWSGWDGCAAIAGANVIGYWHYHGCPSIPDDEETLIDYCHYYMGTNFDGGTSVGNIGPGIEYVMDTIYPYYFDSLQYYSWPFDWDMMVGEINSSHPFVLSLNNWAPAEYSWHSVAVFGYQDESGTGNDYIFVRSGWNTSTTNILRGSWAGSYLDKVFPT
jgi:hypothetical protein